MAAVIPSLYFSTVLEENSRKSEAKDGKIGEKGTKPWSIDRMLMYIGNLRRCPRIKVVEGQSHPTEICYVSGYQHWTEWNRDHICNSGKTMKNQEKHVPKAC